MLLGGRRIYARVFHAKIDETGPKRLGRTLMMREPDPTETRLRLKKADDLAKLIASGGLTMDGGMTEPSPVIAAIVAGMRKAAQAGGSIMDCADAALSEVSQLSPNSLPRAAEPADGAPATVVTPMLQVASSQPIPGTFEGGRPSDPVNATLIRRLATVEELGWSNGGGGTKHGHAGAGGTGRGRRQGRPGRSTPDGRGRVPCPASGHRRAAALPSRRSGERGSGVTKGGIGVTKRKPEAARPPARRAQENEVYRGRQAAAGIVRIAVRTIPAAACRPR